MQQEQTTTAPRKPELYGSELPFHQPNEPIRRLPAVRAPHPDRDVEFAMRSPLDSINVDMETLEKRAVYRPEYDHSPLPKAQNWVVFTTWGPKAEGIYSFDTTKQGGLRGIQILGVFNTPEQADAHVAKVRQIDPHSTLYTIHSEYMSGIIQIPPPNDGDAKHHDINSVRPAIIKDHFDGIVNESRTVIYTRRQTETVAKDHNDKVAKFNAALSGALSASANVQEAEYKRVLEKYQNYPGGSRDPELISTLPNGQSKKEDGSKITFAECADNVKCLTPNLVDEYLKIHETVSTGVGEGQKVEFLRTKRADGKEVIVKVIMQKL